MNDGSIVYEVRVGSDNISGDLERAGSHLDRGSQMFAQLAANTAQHFGKVLSDIFGSSVSLAENSISKLGAGFDRLKNSAAPLLNALKPITSELEKISKLSLSSVGEAVGNTVTNKTNTIINNKSGSGSTGSSSRIPKLATGASYIPYDDFPALLHKGEAVLTATENAALKAAGGIGALYQNEPPNLQNNVNISDDISRRPVEVTLKIGEYEFTQIIADTMNNLYRQWGEKPLK
jgi:uncharacterized phage infection (PIP) family protein YhgE